VHVTKAEEEAEKNLIQTMWTPTLKAVDFSDTLDRLVAATRDQEALTKWLEASFKQLDEENAKIGKPPIDHKN
jgi:isochorismate hydrolase